ncbi:MAG: DUF423 domain-containing protein [Nevskia sp.]|nr:DUF423 domain-containing protein [Nevskia sp.]
MPAARLLLALGGASGFLAVAFGAFGAHVLRARLGADALAIYRTAVEYHFYHALALLGVGLWALLRPAPALSVAGSCFAAGTLLFSGSLYALALSGERWLGAVTPLGGLLFLAGWASVVLAALRSA